MKYRLPSYLTILTVLRSPPTVFVQWMKWLYAVNFAITRTARAF